MGKFYDSKGLNHASSNKKQPSTQRTRVELSREINDLKKLILREPLRAPQVFLTDVTAESLQSALVEQGERMSILTDEGNLFDILSGIYTGGKQNLDVFLQGHAGQPCRVKRQGRIALLNKIALSIGLAVQPSVLSEQKESDRRKFRGKGLLARFLFCLPKSNIGTRSVKKQQPIPTAVNAAYISGIFALLNIKPQYNELDVEVSRAVTLSPEAAESWEQFSQWVETNQGVGGNFERLQDFTGKLPGALLRIAGICHIAENYGSLSSKSALSTREDTVNLSISKETLAPILDLGQRLIVHAQAAFDLMGDDPVIADAKHILKWITQNVEQNDSGAYFFKQNLLHGIPKFKNSKLERVTKALDILRERNIISSQNKIPTKKPTLIYYVNPRILNIKQPESAA